MTNAIKSLLLAAIFCAYFTQGVRSHAMDQNLNRSAAVPLDFLTWIERDITWLRSSLETLDIRDGYVIESGLIQFSTVEALRAANRIRSFAHLAAPGLRPPYFDLTLESEGETVRCVTIFPKAVARGIDAMDFARTSFPTADVNPLILDQCRVTTAAALYAKLDRHAFRERYFDTAGDLRVEVADLNTDPSFVARAIDLGFFVEQQDLTGRLRLGAE